MKKTLKFLAMAFVAGVIFTACGGDDNDDNGGGGDKPKPGNYPPVTVTSKPSGSVKAGMAGAVEILGSGFDEVQDYIYIGYDKGDGTIQFDRVMNDVLAMDESSISFGVRIDAPSVDKTFKVYLDRPTYDKMPLTGDLTFTMPTVAEGYIPDPAFRATLQSDHKDQGNPAIAKLFDSYGMLDVAAAAAIKKCGQEDRALNLYSCAAKSLEGIELFKNVEGNVSAWGMSEIKEIDLSKWMTNSYIVFLIDGVSSLEKIVGAPHAYMINLSNCPNLKSVDMSPCRWLYNLQLNIGGNKSNATYLDIRRQRTGTLKEGDATKEYPETSDDYSIYLPGAQLKVADNCHILVDYQFLLDKRSDGGSGYSGIFDAWKRGATIDVYASKDITRKLATVPMYSADPDALTLTGDNKWTVEDK